VTVLLVEQSSDTVEPTPVAPLTDATHPSYDPSKADREGSMLLGAALRIWQAVSRGQRGGSKAVTANAKALIEHGR